MIDSVAQSKSLVAKLLDIFLLLGVCLGRVLSANGFEKTERNSSVDCRGHGAGWER